MPAPDTGIEEAYAAFAAAFILNHRLLLQVTEAIL